jgi:cation transport regulator ChaC
VREDTLHPPTDTRWYFAYGSNLFVPQMVERTGPIGRAVVCRLTGYRVAFNKRGSNDQIFANILPATGGEVWGVAYALAKAALKDLDRRECGYRRKRVVVSPVGDASFAAVTYVAKLDSLCGEGRPTDVYLGKILRGARSHSLPEPYIKGIETLALRRR